MTAGCRCCLGRGARRRGGGEREEPLTGWQRLRSGQLHAVDATATCGDGGGGDGGGELWGVGVGCKEDPAIFDESSTTERVCQKQDESRRSVAGAFHRPQRAPGGRGL